VEQFDEHGNPFNPPFFRRFIKRAPLPPVKFTGSSVHFHLNRLASKAAVAGGVVATKPAAAAVPDSPELPGSIADHEILAAINAVQEPVEHQSPRLLQKTALLTTAALAGPGLRDALATEQYGKFANFQLPAAAVHADVSRTGDDEGDDDASDSGSEYSGSDSKEHTDASVSESEVSVSRSRVSKKQLKRVVSHTLATVAKQAESMQAQSPVLAAEQAVHTKLSSMSLQEEHAAAADAQRAAEREWLARQMGMASVAVEEDRMVALRVSSLHASASAAAAAGEAEEDEELGEHGSPSSAASSLASPPLSPAVRRQKTVRVGQNKAASAAAAFLAGISSATGGGRVRRSNSIVRLDGDGLVLSPGLAATASPKVAVADGEGLSSFTLGESALSSPSAKSVAAAASPSNARAKLQTSVAAAAAQALANKSNKARK
jgi:hypothetical protein